MSTLNFESLAQQLEEAVTITLNPAVDNATRFQAYKMLDEALNNPSVSVPCGLILVVNTRPTASRHLGLNFLEWAIKYHWDRLTQENKLFVKDNTLRLVLSGCKNVLAEEILIKDKLSRILVELAKRLWPQLWPSMLCELRQLAESGPVQEQIVLMVLIRLSEDIAVLQTIEDSRRRKELYMSLSSHMSELFSWLLALLEQHFTACTAARGNLDSVSSGQSLSESEETFKVQSLIFKDVLTCLTSYSEWVASSHIFADNAKLLRSLCYLLGDENFRTSSAQCLLSIVSRKTSLEERLPLLSLFHEDCLNSIILSAAATSSHLEVNYPFIKTLVQVVTQLCLQLCVLWGKIESVHEPDCFRTFLCILLEFSEHPSLSVYEHVTAAWTALLRHPQSRLSMALAESAPRWLKTLLSRVVLHGVPSWKSCPTSVYSRLDFDDSDDEFLQFFNTVRSEICACLKCSASIWPGLVWRELEQRCLATLQAPLHSVQGEETNAPVERQFIALPFCLSATLKGFPYDVGEDIVPRPACDISKPPPKTAGAQLLSQFLLYRNPNPHIEMLNLNCIGELLMFITVDPSLASSVFNKLLGPVVNYSVHNTGSYKHCVGACYLLRRLSKNFASVMLPGFDIIRHITDELARKIETSPPHSELLHLQTCLLTLNNARCNYEQQASYIASVAEPIKQYIEFFNKTFTSPLSLLNHIGLDKNPLAENDAECAVLRRNRFKLTYYVQLLREVVRCSECPQVDSQQVSGSLVTSSADSSVVRNPASDCISASFYPFLALIRTCNGLYKPEVRAALAPAYRKVFEMSAKEKLNVLGHSGSGDAGVDLSQTDDDESEVSKAGALNELSWMQLYLKTLQESWCMCLGAICQKIEASDFYSLTNLKECTIHAPLYCFEFMPDHTMKLVIRQFCRPWLLSCPPQHHPSLLIPVVGHLASIMMQHLEERWTVIATVDVSREEQECSRKPDEAALESPEYEEVVQALLVRLLSREYLDFVRCLLVARSTSSADARDESKCDAMDSEGGGRITMQGVLSPAGQVLVSEPATLGPLMAVLLRCVGWPDSVSSVKACQLLMSCIRHITVAAPDQMNGLENNRRPPVLGSNDCCAVISALLVGLQAHGQHQDNLQQLLNTICFCYTALRPLCDAFPQLLLKVEGTEVRDIEQLDKLVFQTPVNAVLKNAKLERAKRDLLKKIVKPTIGVSVSEVLKLTVQQSDLPPLFPHNRGQGRATLAQGAADEAEADISSLFAASVEPLISKREPGY